MPKSYAIALWEGYREILLFIPVVFKKETLFES